MTRFVPIGKTMNLRHMGGYDTDNARRTKENYLYRSGFLHFTGDQDLEKFESLGVRVSWQCKLNEDNTEWLTF